MFIVSALLVPLFMLFHFVGPIPVDLGTHGGDLSPCVSSAHCSRQNWSTANLQSDLETIIAAVRDTPRTIIVEERDGYIHAEASSALFGFVDDLELLAKQDTGMIQARSISRLGDSDLGVNSARLDRLKTLINETDQN
jgi:uncharacterized protein (DUF1499 family)